MAVKPRIKLDKKQAKKGDLVEVKALVSHVMESGQRRDSAGNLVARKILNKFTCTVNGKEVFSVIRTTRLVNRSDIGVAKSGEGLDFAVEKPDVFFVDVSAAANDFESHQTLRLLLPGFVDDAHASPAQFARDLVGSDLRRRGAHGNPRRGTIHYLLQKVSDSFAGNFAFLQEVIQRLAISLPHCPEGVIHLVIQTGRMVRGGIVRWTHHEALPFGSSQ